MDFKSVFKKQTWCEHIRIWNRHLGQLYMPTKKTSSTKNKNAWGWGMKWGVRDNAIS